MTILYSLWTAGTDEIQQYEWFPKIPAGQTAVVVLKAQPPYGLLLAKLMAGAPYHGIQESDGSDNEMTVWIGSLVPLGGEDRRRHC